jgi:hypothetical protein
MDHPAQGIVHNLFMATWMAFWLTLIMQWRKVRRLFQRKQLPDVKP